MFEEQHEIVRHVPYLRRYARALLGSQARGDQYVRVCLESLLQEPDRLADAHAPRLALFKLFHEVHDRFSETLGRARDQVHGDTDLEKSIQGLPPRQRQILLLTALEGFSLDEAAQALAIDREAARDLLQAARDELMEQKEIEVLVIEDEPMIAVDIAGIVTEMGHSVVGTAATKDEAIKMALARRPDIILADIKLGDGSSGIDAVDEILDVSTVPVIFVTAYPERLLTGERKEPTYLVTKPFEPETLKVTINHALLLSRQQFATASTDQ